MPRTFAHPSHLRAVPVPAEHAAGGTVLQPAFPRSGTPPEVCVVSLDRLTDDRLAGHLEDVIGEMRRRGQLLPRLRLALSDHLSELRAEALAASTLTAEEIADLSEVTP